MRKLQTINVVVAVVASKCCWRVGKAPRERREEREKVERRERESGYAAEMQIAADLCHKWQQMTRQKEVK